MQFRDLAKLCDKLESTAKRTEMVNLASNFLKRLEPREIEPATCMLLGRPFPNTSDERLDLSWATLVGVIYRVTGADRRDMDAAFAKSGDIGAATAVLFRNRKLKRQQLFSEKPLQLIDVHEILGRVARLKGPGARKRKERMIEGLLNSKEGKFLLVKGRAGVGKTMFCLELIKEFGFADLAAKG